MTMIIRAAAAARPPQPRRLFLQLRNRLTVEHRRCLCSASSSETIFDPSITSTEKNFDELYISEMTKHAITETFQSKILTELQAKSLPTILTGEDCLVKLKPFGTGLSVTIALSAVEAAVKHHMNTRSDSPADDDYGVGMRAAAAALSAAAPMNDITGLILTARRRSVLQISKDINDLTKYHYYIRVETAMGSEKIRIDWVRQQLARANFQLLVANPERLLAILQDNDSMAARLKNLQFLCVDKADLMLAHSQRM